MEGGNERGSEGGSEGGSKGGSERGSEGWSELARGRRTERGRKQETGNRKYLFVPKTTKQSIQHKNHTIYYIYVDMIKRSGKNIEYGLKIKDNVI